MNPAPQFPSQDAPAPDPTALRVALWRALHLLADPPPHVLEDDLALRLADPAEGWRQRPDMDLAGTRGYRASIVARARFVEDLIAAQARNGVAQVVLLGAGLDTFAQRRPDLSARMRIFEVDRPGPQAWKRQRLEELGFGVPESLRLVPVDFEAGQSWWEALAAAGFRGDQRAVAASTGVSMYLTREANLATLQRLAALPPGSTVAMTFLLPLDLLPPPERAQHQAVYDRARAAGTPFLSFFRPEEILDLATGAGFKSARCVSTGDHVRNYFAGRPDDLRPSEGEGILVAET